MTVLQVTSIRYDAFVLFVFFEFSISNYAAFLTSDRMLWSLEKSVKSSP